MIDDENGENIFSRNSLRRRDLWFFIGIMAFVILLFFAWQQNRGLRLADEIARLEARYEALQTRILERGVEVARLRQPDWLMSEVALGSVEDRGLGTRTFIWASPLPEPERGRSTTDALLASVGFEVPRALAAIEGP